MECTLFCSVLNTINSLVYFRVQSKCNNFLLSCTDYTAAVKRCEEGTQFFREVLEQVKQTNEKTVILNEKNSKLRKIIIDK